MNKKAKSALLMCLISLLTAGILFAAYSMFVAAAPIVIPTIVDNGIDDFYYDGQTATFNVTVIWADGPGTTANLTVNCSALGDSQAKLAINTTGLGGLPYMNYTANCTINYSAIPASLIAGQQFAGIMGGNITFTATNTSNSVNTTTLQGIIIGYNMTTPPSPPDPCTKFGPLTTNFANVPDFTRVNFVINMQANFTCLSQGRVNAPDFRDVMILNLTSIDLSTPEKSRQLSLLHSALNVSLVAPHKHGKARIDINSTAFQELNSNATIKFFYLPFTRLPTIAEDNPGKLNSSATTWAPNGFDTALNISTVNLTIVVTGFSGYNFTDIDNPLITLAAPAGNLANGTNALISVIVNGTGTEPSYISISLNSSLSYYYNGTTGATTAQCVNISADKETFNCTFRVNLSDGNYVFNVSAWDFGLGVYPGNYNNSARALVVDTVAPATPNTTVSVTSSGATISYTSNESVNVSISYGSSDSLGSSASSSTYASSGSVALSSLTASTTYYYNTTICDQAGNCATNGTLNFTTSAATTTTESLGGGISTSVPSSVDLSSAEGYTKALVVAEELSFTINNEQHSIFVKTMTQDSVTLKISSEPQIITLKTGEDKKLNLDTDNYYDLYIKVNKIVSGLANITIKGIHESISGAAVSTGGQNLTAGEAGAGAPAAAGAGEAKKPWMSTTALISIIVIVVVIVLVILFLAMRKNHRIYKR